MVEAHHADSVLRGRLFQFDLGSLQRLCPEVGALHGATGIDQQNDPSALTQALLRKRPGEEGAGEGEGQQTDHQTAKQQQGQVFQTAASLKAGWGRAEKHECAKGDPSPGGAPDQVQQDGHADGSRARQEQGEEKTHAELLAWAWTLGRICLRRWLRPCRNSMRATSKGRSVANKW